MNLNQKTTNYLNKLTSRLQTHLGDQLVGVQLGGSAVLDDYRPGASDLDVIAVVAGKIGTKKSQQLAQSIAYDTLACPADGLELYVIQQKKLQALSRWPSYELLVRTGKTWQLDVQKRGSEIDLLMDLAICRAHGQALLGPLPQALIPVIPHGWIVRALHQSLDWRQHHLLHAFHDPQGENAVLGACRAWHYYNTHCFASKTAAGKWMLAQELPEPDRELVETALQIRSGRYRQNLDPQAMYPFVRQTKYALRATLYHRLMYWLRTRSH